MVQPKQTGAHRAEGEPAWAGVLPQPGLQPGLHQSPKALLLHHPLQIQSTPVMTRQNKQCCGSGSRSNWIRIRLVVLDPDPDPGALKFAFVLFFDLLLTLSICFM